MRVDLHKKFPQTISDKPFQTKALNSKYASLLYYSLFCSLFLYQEYYNKVILLPVHVSELKFPQELSFSDLVVLVINTDDVILLLAQNTDLGSCNNKLLLLSHT